MGAAVVCGDALSVLKQVPDETFDAIVTDPPAGISFMGRVWDHDHGGRDGWVKSFGAIFAECFRVLKPGGRAFVWSIPRTSHWTACAVEDAGFVIENVVMHVFGSGFPKGKGQLKPSYEPWILCRKPGGKVQPLGIDACRVGTVGGGTNCNNRDEHGNCLGHDNAGRSTSGPTIHAKVTMEASAGRWPPNLVLSHSPPTLDDDGNEIAPGCVRVGEKRVATGTARRSNLTVSHFGDAAKPLPDLGFADADGLETVADWRCVDGCPVKLMGEQSGESKSTGGGGANKPGVGGNGAFGVCHLPPNVGKGGTAARFFPQFEPDPPFIYAAKTSRSERNRGCGPERESGPRRNHHPTVKPQALMRWLLRLITPSGGLVLDPFAGSGSTGVACVAEGFSFLGIEREREYVVISDARLAYARENPVLDGPKPRNPKSKNLLKTKPKKEENTDSVLDLFLAD